jgi:glycosyltransferase involved in cell wall biosynthesis
VHQPLVSIVCITFNHELFIEQAIEGFLMQKTSFPYEIVIGEDCSTDRTRQICLEYFNNQKDKIRLLPSQDNLGYIKNFRRSVHASKGKYIALCEGDDYWTDPLKLQKQVNFFEDNPNYAIVHTNKDIKRGDIIFKSHQEVINSDNVFEDILCYNNICALTVLVRAEVFKKSLEKIINHAEKRQWDTLDYPIWLDIAMNHNVGFLTDITGVHRFLPGSISHSLVKSKAYSFERNVIEIKELFFKEYLKKNPGIGNSFRFKVKENLFHLRKRLLLDYGFRDWKDIFALLAYNPLFYIYIIYKKSQRIFEKHDV